MDNDNSFGIALLDIGTGFTVLNGCIENDVPYGTFALTLINADYGKIRNAISDVVHKFFDKGFNPNDTDAFAQSLYNKVDFHISYASKGYLLAEQAHMVTELLVREILSRIQAEHFEITDIEKCMPVMFSDSEIRNNIMDILKRSTYDLTPIMQKTGAFEIDSQLINMEMPVYYLKSISDYLLLDLKMYIERSNKTVKACERCNRLFLPSRKNDKYCRLPIRGSRKTCNEIMHISPDDVFAKERNKARDKQHKKIRYYEEKETYEHNFLYNLYDNWSDECSKKCTEFKAKNDIENFKNWIEESKFTADCLKEKWKQYQSAVK